MRGTIIREIMRWKNQTNELGVLKESDMLDKEKLTKINVTKILKIKIELGDATLETIIQETNPDLTKYNKIMCATAKVMTALCSNENS